MKHFKIMLLFLTAMFAQNILAQTRVLIGDLYYNLSGVSASVTYSSSSSTFNTNYTNDSYTIPSTVSYNGLEYTVNEIGVSAFHHSAASSIKLPNTIIKIGQRAFEYCKNLTSIIIPASVESIYYPFSGCDFLRTIIYLPPTAPSCWTATSFTYVPDLESYSSPYYSMNDAHVIEMISFDQTEFEYTGQTPTTTWTNNVDGYTASLNMSALNAEVGEHEAWIPVTFTKEGEEPFTANVVYRYTIKPAKLTAKVNNVSREYGEENPQFNIVYTGFVSGENESVLTEIPSASTIATISSNVGEYPITVSGGSASNYEIVYEPGKLTITKAPLSAKVNDATKQYGTGNPAFSVSYTGLKNDETVPQWSSTLQFSTEATSSSDVGEYLINATGIPVNYDLPSITQGVLTITQAPLIIKANDATRMYYEVEPTFGFACSGFVNNDDKQVLTTQPTIVTEAMQTSDVGVYAIIPSGAFAKNYTISYEQGLLTITKRPLTVTSNCTREYGEENSAFTLDYDGFVNNENDDVITIKPTATTTATMTSNVGEYPITISGGSAINYDFIYQQGVLTVTKAPLSAKVNDETKQYGTKNPAFTIEYYGLKNEETAPTWMTQPTFQTNATQVSSVGQYEVKAVNGVPVNYNLGEVTPGTLTITPAPLTIKANDATRQYYSEEPNFSYTCNGFVNGENESAFATTPTLSTSATKSSNVGTYEIKVSGATSQNYSISHINGTLTITPRTLMASVGNYERLYNEENPAFEVKYDGFVGNEDENVLSTKPTANTTATKMSDVGTYPINVTGGSADNYKFSYTSGILTINKAEQTLTWDQDLTNLNVGDQVELKAVASSGLPITYTMDDNSLAEIYSAGTKMYLDCKAGGHFLIRAVQRGNKNYYSSPKASNAVTIAGSNPPSDPVLTIKQADNGSISTQVSKGSVYTFTIAANNGWKVHSVTFNDEDVTSQLNNNVYTTPAITGKSTLSVVYEEENSAVRPMIESSVKIQGTSFGVRVIDANVGDMIQVYSSDGILQKSVKAEGQVTDILLSKDKVYIVKVGGKTVKLSY